MIRFLQYIINVTNLKSNKRKKEKRKKKKERKMEIDMEIITINITNSNNIISAKSETGSMEIILDIGVVLYNGVEMHIDIDDIDFDDDNNMDFLYLGVSLRKAIFDNPTLRRNHNSCLTTLRRMTASYPFPENIKLNYIKIPAI